MDKTYTNTRWQLSLLYFAIIFFIVLFFSIELTREQFSEYDRVQHFTHNYYSSLFPGVGFDRFDNTINQLKQNILINTIKADVIILVIAGAGSYYLSGKTLEPIEKTMKQQQTFVADASHELKTPIAAILTEAEVLQRSKSSTKEEYVEFTQSAIEEMHRLTDLTNNLLAIAKGAQNQPEDVKKEINLSEVINQEFAKFESKAKLQNISLNLDIENSLTIVFSEGKFIQLMDILIDNAIKYNKKNGQVIAKAREDPTHMNIILEDSGIGIPQMHLPNIFNRFYRVSQDRNIKGFGLGLSIAKEIVESSNGSINIESEPGQYTRIIISLLR